MTTSASAGRWYFRRRLPCYWYATDLNRPPIGARKMRWPGREPYEGSWHDLWPSWKSFWANPPAGEAEVAAARPTRRSSSPRCAAARPIRRSVSAETAADARHAVRLRWRSASCVLRNRIVMAPMTRNRAGAGDAPGELAAAYYGARAAAGLIVTEGTQPSKHGKGYARTPGPVQRGAAGGLAARHRSGACAAAARSCCS